jgi:hypothetical protein
LTDWINMAARGLAVGHCPQRQRSYASAFTIAKEFDPAARSLRLPCGKALRVPGRAEKVEPNHYRTVTLGLTSGTNGIINSGKNRVLRRPENLPFTYITESEVELPADFSANFLRDPSQYLHNIQPLASQLDSAPAPQSTTLPDPRMVPWHFPSRTRMMIGFSPRNLLDRLGLNFQPLGDVEAANNWLRHNRTDMQVPFETTATNSLQTAPTQLARIKHYSDQEMFSGVYEYEIRCPSCRNKFDFPTGKYVERYLKLRCPSCEYVFFGEVLRSNLSLRFSGDWRQTKD